MVSIITTPITIAFTLRKRRSVPIQTTTLGTLVVV